MTKPLFTAGSAADIAYRNVRAADDEFMRAVRDHCESLWALYEPYADPEFLVEIRSTFDPRYWEMYLTTCLMKAGFKVKCPKPGPDVGIVFAHRRIWFEATSPTPGNNEGDQVPKLEFVTAGQELVMQDVPNEKMLLRYLNSIVAKKQQYAQWIQQNIVSRDDAFVVAINPRRLGHEFADSNPPRILQAAFPLGPLAVAIDPKTAQIVDTKYQFRDKIEKSSGAEVATGVFLQNDYECISGLLCSRIDAANLRNEEGDDFQLVPNPNARVSLPTEFRLKGTYFRVEHDKDRFSVIPEIPN